MKKTLITILMLVGLSCLLGLTPLRAQENATDEDKFSFGKIVSVAEGQITVKEYDFAKDTDVETTYYLSAETELGNINAVKDLVAGDDVVLDYAEKDGKRMVTTLVKEEKGGEAPAPEGEAAKAAAPAAAVASAPVAAAPVSAEIAPAPVAAAPVAEVQPATQAAPVAAAQPAAEVAPAAPAAATTAPDAKPAQAPSQQ